MSSGNTISLVPLHQLTPDRWIAIVDDLDAQNSSDYLPTSYTSQQLAGFEAQRRLIAASLRRTDNAAIEIPFFGGSSFSTVVMKGVSRGTVLLNPGDIYGEPVFDFGAFRNPVDAYIMGESYDFIRRWHKTSIMAETFLPIEILPGINATTRDELVAFARSSSSPTTGHLSGTSAMMPRDLGGVVGTDLRVHGVTGLTVADASVMPLIPGAHLCTTVYAVAEKVRLRLSTRNKK